MSDERWMESGDFDALDEAHAASEPVLTESGESEVVEVPAPPPPAERPTDPTEPRHLDIRWIGPFQYRNALRRVEAGLYLISVGQEALYIGASATVPRTLAEHVIYDTGRVYAGDMLGRDLLKWSRAYKTRLQVKVARVFETESGRPVVDAKSLDDVMNLIQWSVPLPCNPYGRDRYLGTQTTVIHNYGKRHPLLPEYASPVVDPNNLFGQ